MRGLGGIAVTLVLCATAARPVAASGPGTGVIRGEVRLAGAAQANPLIRMGMDPGCAALRQGQRPQQELVVIDASGGLANVFVAVQGTFPRTSPPTTPVVLDQRGCLYTPRVVGARAGQVLQIRNSDNLLHNVHSSSSGRNTFNVGQPGAGIVFEHRLAGEEGMVRVRCDVHGWMTAFVGIVEHPYFDVTRSGGTFEIKDIPAGDYPIRIWHEVLGEQTRTVTVLAGRVTTLDLVYSGTTKR